MKKVITAMCVAAALVVINLAAAEATEIDILVDKLVQKGILTPLEAQIILDETKADVASKMAKGTSSGSPQWAQDIKIKGDLRLRYQVQKAENDAVDRHRARYRYRLGVQGKVIDGVMAYAGIASGGADPRSTNETLDDSFETKGANLDYAYAQWTPVDWLTVSGGKIKGMPFYTTSDLLWDGDINPEGAAVNVYYTNILPNFDLFSNLGFFVLDEAGDDGSDPMLYVAQGGGQLTMYDTVTAKCAVTGYIPHHEQGTTFEHTAGTNSLQTNPPSITGSGTLKYHYDAIALNAELGIARPPECLIHYVGAFGDYIINPDPGGDNQGFLIGGKIGEKKVSKRGNWQAKALYRHLERDAWLDIFPDSDARDGSTNICGPEMIFQYALMDNVILGFDYYYTKNIDGDGNRQHLFQTDLQLKF